MWYADIVLDLQWLATRSGNLGKVRGRALQAVFEPDLQTEVLLFGDEEAIRHMRIMIHTDDDPTARACVDRNIHQWLDALAVSSALATASIAKAAQLHEDSAAFMVIVGQGEESAPARVIEPRYQLPLKADYGGAAKLMTAWNPEFRVHLHYLSRFLNRSYPPEVRWLNGYRLLEWHFLRGGTDLGRDGKYRALIDTHGAALDAHRHAGQTRFGVIEEVRALVAHALLSEASDPRAENGSTDLILGTFSALEALVAQVMNEGVPEGTSFKLKAS